MAPGAQGSAVQSCPAPHPAHMCYFPETAALLSVNLSRKPHILFGKLQKRGKVSFLGIFYSGLFLHATVLA